MSWAIGTAILIFNLYVLNRNRENGIILYCVLILVCPSSYFGDYSIGYDWVSFPIVILMLMENYSINRSIQIASWIWINWFFWLIGVTFSNYNIISNEINWFGIIGLVKYFCIFLLLSSERWFHKNFLIIISIIIWINVIACGFQYIFSVLISDAWVLEVQRYLYGTVGNWGAMQAELEVGRITRFYGTFPSSAYLGILSIVGLYGFWHKYTQERRAYYYLLIISCLFLGIVSSTKRFYLGFWVLGVYYLLITKFSKQKSPSKDIVRNRACIYNKFISIIFGGLAAILFFVFFKDRIGTYYISFLLNMDFARAFYTRFSDIGVVAMMRPYIYHYPIAGVGNLLIDGVRVTDSLLYMTLFWSGVVGLAIMILFFVCLFKNVVQEKDLFKYLIFGGMLIEFVISTMVWSPLGIIFLSYLCPRNISLCSKSSEREEKFC